MAKNVNRFKLHLMCSECKNLNYTTQRNKNNTEEKIEVNKFCKTCNKTTKHKEKSIK